MDSTSPPLLLTPSELVELTSYRQAFAQLRELHRQGFHRARRNRLGDVVLERGHYDAVVAGHQAPAEQRARPVLRSLMRPPRGK